MSNTSWDFSELPLLFKDVPWMIVYICEAVLILTGNSITVYIFWSIRKRLKRTSCLLINLAVADIFVGIGLILYIGADVDKVMFKSDVSFNLGVAIVLIDMIARLSSILSLVVISLERVFAILWPFRHRLLEARYYYVSVGFVWLLSALNIIPNLLGSNLTDKNSYSIFTAVTFITSVLVITAAYLAIWISTRRNQIPNNDGRSMEKNRKLAKTLFIVTALSIITCLPFGIIIAFTDFSEDLVSFWVQITIVAQYANSFLNPVVYCFRMPAFKASLKKLLCHCSPNRLSLSERSQCQCSTSGVTLKSMRSV